MPTINDFCWFDVGMYALGFDFELDYLRLRFESLLITSVSVPEVKKCGASGCRVVT